MLGARTARAGWPPRWRCGPSAAAGRVALLLQTAERLRRDAGAARQRGDRGVVRPRSATVGVTPHVPRTRALTPQYHPPTSGGQ